MIKNFKKQLQERGYPERFIQNTLSEVNFEDRKLALQQKRGENKRILPFVTQYQPSVPNLKQIIMNKWHLIKKQPLLNEIFKEPPLISHKKRRSLKDILVRAKLWERLKHERGSHAGLSPPFYTLEISRFCMSNLKLSRFCMSNLEISRSGMQNIEISIFDMQNIEISRFDMQNLEISIFDMQNIEISIFCMSNLEISIFVMQNIEISRFDMQNLEISIFDMQNIEISIFDMQNLEISIFCMSNLEISIFCMTNIEISRFGNSPVINSPDNSPYVTYALIKPEHDALPRKTWLSYLRKAPDVKQETEMKYQRWLHSHRRRIQVKNSETEILKKHLSWLFFCAKCFFLCF